MGAKVGELFGMMLNYGEEILKVLDMICFNQKIS